MNTKAIATIGLILGMVGVLLLFIWGPPQPSFEQGVGLGLSDIDIVEFEGERITVGEKNKIVKRRYTVHKVMSSIGLGFVFVGFSFQFVAIRATPNKKPPA